MIKKSFYTRDSVIVAKELLGKIINHQGKKAMIVETEAYTTNDPGSHAYSKRTKRNELMFREGGCLYVYLCYGVHELMNIVTDKEGIPSAVLIRAVEPLNFKGRGCGPGLTAKAIGITRENNGESVLSNELHLEKGFIPAEIVQTTRIGLRNGQELPYRFYIKGNQHVSNK